MDKVRFGFFPSFSDPTVLFFGTAEALGDLRDAILSLRQQSPLKLDEDSRLIPLNNTTVTVSLSNVERGMHRVDTRASAFTWQLSDEDVTSAAERISAVINRDKPSHHCLDSLPDDFVVVVSKGEYPDTFAA